MAFDYHQFSRQHERALKRKVNTRGAPKELFLIVCEGEKTEPNYFKKFRLPADVYVSDVDVYGVGAVTESLVRETIKIRQVIKKSVGKTYDQVWCVFDKDDNPAEQFNRALALADREGIKVAYSNEAFELWYLLHFNYIDSVTSRAQYKRKLSHRLGQPYIKNSEDMYDKLLSRQQDAIRNADRLLKSYGFHKPCDDNPCTLVHHLVIELNKYL